VNSAAAGPPAEMAIPALADATAHLLAISYRE
jgi:hypothetical protein